MKVCKGACRGKGGNMHSKFFLFTNSGTGRHVVMVSSSNLNRGGARLGWNDMFVVKGRKKLYNGFKRMHRAMTEDIKATADKVEVRDGPYIARFFPMRNANKRTDPTMQDLRRVRCSSALGRTQIHVSMFYWKGTRGSYILNKLVSLARSGCKVRIIYGAPSIALAERMRNLARNRVIDLWDSRWDHNDDGFNEVRTHAKYVLVKGTVGKNRRAHQVWTGSQNWVGGSLFRSDELTLNIAKRGAYKSYLGNWKQIRKHSRRLPYSMYPPRVG
ncbi:phospholipase D-like domain-containing protein [Nocardioides sp. TF02-7]|uniref:phospholipase D-like domain-containing protein n=1 Tax=Nocardioides sp. TF02-7 TaxID=2917724 RepID=UPI001F06D274|nr:phospholipase D-like domain-containing protein [Nocardioides sp. TF02-7]UMG93207.1 phospholipase D family protein [Nocardioides sp. TF02-7]